jgi:hypothetical protein
VRKAVGMVFTVALLAGGTSRSGVTNVVEGARHTNASQGVTVTAEQQRAIDAYAAELKRVQAGQEKSMEPLLAAAGRIKSLLNEPFGPQQQPRPQVDELAEVELRRIERQLIGISIHIGDTIDVSPDREFYLFQAKLHGGPVDIAFFALLNRAYGPSGWPVWIERTGPESGCIDFTSGELVDLFWAWQRFLSEHPRRYVEAVDHEVRKLEEDLLAPDSRRCPQDPAMIQRELRRLASLLPEHPIAKKIVQRLTTTPGR